MNADVVASALAAGAKFVVANEVVYAAYAYDDLGWWVSRLEPGAPDYFVDRAGRCTCPAYSPDRGCKHVDSLKMVGAFEQEHTH